MKIQFDPKEFTGRTCTRTGTHTSHLVTLGALGTHFALRIVLKSIYISKAGDSVVARGCGPWGLNAMRLMGIEPGSGQ